MFHLDVTGSYNKVALYIQLRAPLPPSSGSLGWAIVPDPSRNVNEHNFKLVMRSMREHDSAKGSVPWR